MVFVRPESPLRETKSQAADAWFRAPSAVTRKRPASPLPCPRSTGTLIPDRPVPFAVPFRPFSIPHSSVASLRENGHSSGFFRLFACICPEMMYSIRYTF